LAVDISTGLVQIRDLVSAASEQKTQGRIRNV